MRKKWPDVEELIKSASFICIVLKRDEKRFEDSWSSISATDFNGLHSADKSRKRKMNVKVKGLR